jgi:hypothetical protein
MNPNRQRMYDVNQAFVDSANVEGRRSLSLPDFRVHREIELPKTTRKFHTLSFSVLNES